MLSKHCCRISDGEGRRTFVTAMPPFVRACEKQGFREIARHEVDLTRYGGDGRVIVPLMLREAQSQND